MEAEEVFDFIDQYLKNELTGERLILFEEKLRKDPEFLQEVELQRRIIQVIKKNEIRNILRKADRNISEEIKSNFQKYFEQKEASEFNQKDVLIFAKKQIDLESAPKKFYVEKSIKIIEESPKPKEFISISYEGDANPPFPINIESGKAMFEHVSMEEPFGEYSFHYRISSLPIFIQSNLITLLLIGDFDPATLTLIFHKQFSWWSLKLRIESKEYTLDMHPEIMPLSE